MEKSANYECHVCGKQDDFLHRSCGEWKSCSHCGARNYCSITELVPHESLIGENRTNHHDTLGESPSRCGIRSNGEPTLWSGMVRTRFDTRRIGNYLGDRFLMCDDISSEIVQKLRELYPTPFIASVTRPLYRENEMGGRWTRVHRRLSKTTCFIVDIGISVDGESLVYQQEGYLKTFVLHRSHLVLTCISLSLCGFCIPLVYRRLYSSSVVDVLLLNPTQIWHFVFCCAISTAISLFITMFLYAALWGIRSVRDALSRKIISESELRQEEFSGDYQRILKAVRGVLNTHGRIGNQFTGQESYR